MHLHTITIAMHPALLLLPPIPAIWVIVALHYLLIQCLRSEFWGALSRCSSSQDQPQLDWHQLWQMCISAFSQIWSFHGLSWRVLAFCLKCLICLYHKQFFPHVLPKFPFLFFKTDTILSPVDMKYFCTFIYLLKYVPFILFCLCKTILVDLVFLFRSSFIDIWSFLLLSSAFSPSGLNIS